MEISSVEIQRGFFFFWSPHIHYQVVMINCIVKTVLNVCRKLQMGGGGGVRFLPQVVVLHCIVKTKSALKLFSKMCCFGFQTRVVSQNHNERCFHIFYQLCVGATSEMKGERH